MGKSKIYAEYILIVYYLLIIDSSHEYMHEEILHWTVSKQHSIDQSINLSKNRKRVFIGKIIWICYFHHENLIS